MLGSRKNKLKVILIKYCFHVNLLYKITGFPNIQCFFCTTFNKSRETAIDRLQVDNRASDIATDNNVHITTIYRLKDSSWQFSTATALQSNRKCFFFTVWDQANQVLPRHAKIGQHLKTASNPLVKMRWNCWNTWKANYRQNDRIMAEWQNINYQSEFAPHILLRVKFTRTTNKWESFCKTHKSRYSLWLNLFALVRHFAFKSGHVKIHS